MDEDRARTAVMWLSAHIDAPLDTLKDREYHYEEDWDWNKGFTPSDPILGLKMVWNGQCYIPVHYVIIDEGHF